MIKLLNIVYCCKSVIYIKKALFLGIKKATYKSRFVPTTELFTNQIYESFRKLYELKPVLEQAGLYPIPSSLSNNYSLL